MTYLIEPYFLAGVLIISFALGFFANETRMESKQNKLKSKIKDLEVEIVKKLKIESMTFKITLIPVLVIAIMVSYLLNLSFFSSFIWFISLLVYYSLIEFIGIICGWIIYNTYRKKDKSPFYESNKTHFDKLKTKKQIECWLANVTGIVSAIIVTYLFTKVGVPLFENIVVIVGASCIYIIGMVLNYASFRYSEYRRYVE